MEPCDLYLVRHAIAAERGEEWPDDTKRPLTDAGIARFKESVEGLAWLDVEIDEIFTSPLVRTKQTATLLAHGLGNKTSVKTLDALAPGHTPTMCSLSAYELSGSSGSWTTSSGVGLFNRVATVEMSVSNSGMPSRRSRRRCSPARIRRPNP